MYVYKHYLISGQLLYIVVIVEQLQISYRSPKVWIINTGLANTESDSRSTRTGGETPEVMT